MKFKFRLQRVLEVREIVEQQKQKEHSIAKKKLQEKETRLNQMIEKKNIFAGQMTRTRKLTVREVAGHHHYLAALAGKIDEVREEISQLARDVEEKRLNVLKASQDRQSLEKLRQKQQDEHIKSEATQEQHFLDEISMRRQGVMNKS